MPSRDLPTRPHLDHLRHEAKALRHAFARGEAGALERVRAAIGPTTSLKLTEAQRVVAREYGFASWAKLRGHVQASRGADDAIAAFFAAMLAGDAGGAAHVVRTMPALPAASLHVAAALGREAEVRRHLSEDPAKVRTRAGDPPSEPLLWLCYSPFHGSSPQRDRGLEASARALLGAGADPNTVDGRYDIPVLYAVTGERNVPRIARLLLEAGARPNDGESLFHAAERYHEDALELLLAHGADPNFVGDWGNTALYFLLSHWDVGREDRVRRGLHWLLDHGADPDVRSGRERETALHAAVRRGQSPGVVRLLLDRGADPQARRVDGRTPWLLAHRGGFDELKTILEQAGAQPEPLSASDELVAACSRGDERTARRLASPGLVSGLEPTALRLLPEAARSGRLDVVRACLAAGWPVDTADEIGATALHQAGISGRAPVVRELLRHGAGLTIRDAQHRSTPIDWACFGADFVAEPGGDHADCVRAMLEAGARPSDLDHQPRNPAVRDVLGRYGEG